MASNQTVFTLLQLSDLHLLESPADTLMGVNTEKYWQQVLELALRQHPHPDLLLLTGDLAQAPCPASYQRLQNTLAALSIPSICLPGNHDDYVLMQKLLTHKHISCTRQHSLGNWQFINLNSQIIGKAGGYLTKQELDLIDHCIKQQPDLNVFISVHHHCIATQSRWMDSMQISNSEEFFEHLKQYPQVRAITTGHIHQEQQTSKNNINIYAAPSTCFQFTPLSADFAVDTLTPGYRWFKLHASGQIESGVERLAGTLQGLDPKAVGY